MVKVINGIITGSGKRLAIVVSKFNHEVTKRLLDACLDELAKNGVSQKNITVAWVPGSFEIPIVAQKLAKKKSIDAVICLGCIIKGETFHYELVAYGATYGIAQVAVQTGKPVVFEVLATDTVELANERSKVKGYNKGRDAALVALEMINTLASIK